MKNEPAPTIDELLLELRDLVEHARTMPMSASVLVNREDSNIVKNGFAQRAMRDVFLFDHLGRHDIHIITRPD